jgi:hypothetical protein
MFGSIVEHVVKPRAVLMQPELRGRYWSIVVFQCPGLNQCMPLSCVQQRVHLRWHRTETLGSAICLTVFRVKTVVVV